MIVIGLAMSGLLFVGALAAIATLKSDEPLLIRLCAGMTSVAAFTCAWGLASCV